MPELAEVEFYRKRWIPGTGKIIRRVQLHPRARIFRDTSPRAITGNLPGEALISGHAHGKQLLFEFTGGHWLGVHLGMTGILGFHSDEFEPEKHDHLVLRTDGGSLVFTDPRMFGRVRYDHCDHLPSWWADLPPAILDREFSRAHLARFIRRFPRSPLKTVLLDQRGFPGIGNWMADEICWRARLHPATKCHLLDEDRLAGIWRDCREVSRKALAIIGTEWRDPPKSWLFLHRWSDGGRCPRPRCGAELERFDLRGRTSCRCPACQP